MSDAPKMTRDHVLVVERSQLGSIRTAAVFPADHPAHVAIMGDAERLAEVAAFLRSQTDD